MLNSEATAGENLKEAFNKLKAHIGGMKRIQDSFLDGDLSVAWDGFVEAGNKLRFMRVNSELGDGDTAVRTNVEYAFLDGKPMAILKKGSRDHARRLGREWRGHPQRKEQRRDRVSDDEAQGLLRRCRQGLRDGRKEAAEEEVVQPAA